MTCQGNSLASNEHATNDGSASGRRSRDYLGQANIHPAAELQVDSTQDFEIVFTVGGKGLQKGGRVQFTFPPVWSKAQVEDEAAPGYVRAEDYVGRPVPVFVDMQSMEQYILVEAPRDMMPGDEIKILWYQVRLQLFPRRWWGEKSGQVMDLDVVVDRDGSGYYRVLPEESTFTLNIVPRPTKAFFVVAPSIVTTGERFTLKIVANDEFRNPAYPYYEGEVFLSSVPEGAKLPGSCRFRSEDQSRRLIGEVVLEEEGTYRIRVSDGTGTLLGVSNPIICNREGTGDTRLFWGDIHIHSGLSDDALGTPESPNDCYIYARDYACLDFAAVTDHIHTERIRDERIWRSSPDGPFAYLHLSGKEWGWLGRDDWMKITQAAARFNEEGVFVTFLGFEMEEPFGGVGHRCVYFLAGQEPLFPETEDPTIEDLWAYLEGKTALVVPHHSLLLMGWQSHNPRYEKLAEVYSSWGSSEYQGNPLWTIPRVDFAIPGEARGGMSVQEMLATGAKLGLIASGDNHSQGPGRSPDHGRFPLNMTHRVGTAAVYAPELTRQQLFQALHDRQCYATTGERIILDFRLNEAVMGEIVRLTKGTSRRIKIDVIGTSAIDRIEIIRDNVVLYTYQTSVEEETVEYEDEGKLEDGFDHFYYVRVTQSDGNMAWSSPIWVSFHTETAD